MSKLTAVPKPSEPAADAVARLQGIQRRLTENESQRTEVTGSDLTGVAEDSRHYNSDDPPPRGRRPRLPVLVALTFSSP